MYLYDIVLRIDAAQWIEKSNDCLSSACCSVDKQIALLHHDVIVGWKKDTHFGEVQSVYFALTAYCNIATRRRIRLQLREALYSMLSRCTRQLLCTLTAFDVSVVGPY